MDPEAATTDLLWALFRRIDKSRDGNISVKELNRARKSGELDITPEEAKALMRFSDEDDKGEKLLSFPAFYVASTEKKLDPRITPSILKTFTNIDMNNDGYVDRKDLNKAAEVQIGAIDWAHEKDGAAGRALLKAVQEEASKALQWPGRTSLDPP